jgi:5S rRNA maturation endonuclease (ribonuclease M5)
MIDCWFSPTKELIKANKVCAYLDICSKFLINAKHCYINDVLMKVKKDNNSLKKVKSSNCYNDNDFQAILSGELLWKIIVKIKMHSSITKMTSTRWITVVGILKPYLDICSKFLINAKHCYINDVLMKVKKDNNSLKKVKSSNCYNDMRILKCSNCVYKIVRRTDGLQHRRTTSVVTDHTQWNMSVRNLRNLIYQKQQTHLEVKNQTC